jgi:RHS repeat-associated protein
VIAITGDSGEVKDTRLLSFDAWGKRRNLDWSEGSTDPNFPPTDQYSGHGMLGNLGYTGHESIPEVGLIHMNGRVYDPELGRFLSADPNIQSPDDSQSYNRYSYVQNNPLRYTDPSGYFSLKDISQGLSTFISMALYSIPHAGPYLAAAYNAAYAKANGADNFMAALNAAASVVGGEAGSNFSNIFAQYTVQGAVSGGITGLFNAARNGGSGLRGMLRGAANGAAAGLIMAVIRVAIGALLPEGVGYTREELMEMQANNDGGETLRRIHALKAELTAGICGVNMSCIADPEALAEARIEAAGRLSLSNETKDAERGILLYIDREGDVRLSDFMPGNKIGLEDWRIGGFWGKDAYTKAGMYGIDGKYQIVELVHNHLKGDHGRLFSGDIGGDIYISERININVSLTYGSELYLYKPTGNVNLERAWTIRPKGGERICNGCFP